jgi:hypothetical protein
VAIRCGRALRSSRLFSTDRGGGKRQGADDWIKTSDLPQQIAQPRAACSLIQVAVPSLRQPTKPRANIIPRYAPILASTVFSFFAVDGVAKTLE